MVNLMLCVFFFTAIKKIEKKFFKNGYYIQVKFYFFLVITLRRKFQSTDTSLVNETANSANQNRWQALYVYGVIQISTQALWGRYYYFICEWDLWEATPCLRPYS